MTSRAETTQARLRAAALDVIKDRGIAAASARTIAAAAETNQALIFYHFGTVSELIEAASAEAVEERIAHYRAALADVTALPELLTIARTLHEQERTEGTMTVMTQLMAAAPNDPVIARATRHALAAWSAEVERVLRRVLDGTPATGLLDRAGLARLITAAFVGIELTHGADPDATEQAFATLDRLNDLIALFTRGDS